MLSERTEAELEHCYAIVLRGLTAACGSRERAEDALQDAIVSALRTGEADRIRRLDGWLYVVGLRALRKGEWRRRLERPLIGLRGSAPAPGVERLAAVEMLTRLTPRQREMGHRALLDGHELQRGRGDIRRDRQHSHVDTDAGCETVAPRAGCRERTCVDDNEVKRTEDEIRARLQRDLRSIAVRPYAEYRARAQGALRPRPRSLTIAAALAGGTAVVLLALLVGYGLADLRRNVAASPTPGPIQTTPAASVAASASPSPTASPTPLPSGRPAGGIEAYPLGALRGEYAFVVNGGANTMPGAVAEVWAVPLAGGEPRLAVRFANATTPRTSTGENRLARQFSPDGRRLVLAAATQRAAGGERVGLFIVELETGRVSAVGTEEAAEHENPAWSPDGRRIAYVRRPIVDERTGGLDDGVWVMNVDGTGRRKVALLPAGAHPFPRTHIDGWTPDGRLAWSYQNVENTLTLTDIDSGTHTTIKTGGDALRGPSFRTAVPRIAASFSDRPASCPGHYVAVLDGAPERVLVRAPERPQCALRIHSVRWSPARDEIIYLLERETATNELHTVDLSGATRRLAAGSDPVIAEWSPGGTHVLYIRRTAAEQIGQLRFVGGELRSVRRDDSDDRMLFAPRAGAALSDLALRQYE